MMPRHPYAVMLPYITTPSEASIINCGIAANQPVEIV